MNSILVVNKNSQNSGRVSYIGWDQRSKGARKFKLMHDTFSRIAMLMMRERCNDVRVTPDPTSNSQEHEVPKTRK